RTARTGSSGMRVVPVGAEAVSHIAEPPVDELVRPVDRRHQTLLRPSSARAFPEPDMQLTQRPEIGPPVTDVEFRALRDAHPDPAPERRSEVVPRGGQISSLILERGGPPAEEPADLRIGRRHTDLAQRRARLPVVLVDGLLDHPIGQAIDVAL